MHINRRAALFLLAPSAAAWAQTDPEPPPPNDYPQPRPFFDSLR